MKHATTKRLNMLRRITMGLALAVCISGLASIATSAVTKAKDVKADVVCRNGFIYTVDGVRSRAEAFAVKDGKFIAVGTNEDMKAVVGPDTKTVDLKGKMVMPGLIDTHIHALRGALTALGLAFPVTASVDEIKAAVKKFIADKKLKKGERVDVETAIEIFTRNGTMAMEKENETGTIEPGKSADFIVINQNLLEIPEEKIHETKVLQTVLQGKTVYQSK